MLSQGSGCPWYQMPMIRSSGKGTNSNHERAGRINFMEDGPCAYIESVDVRCSKYGGEASRRTQRHDKRSGWRRDGGVGEPRECM